MNKIEVDGYSMNLSELTGRRLMMRRAGFDPIPVNGKKPEMKEWQEKRDVTVGEIKQWERAFSQSTNTGMLTRNTPTLDIDILNEEAAVEIEKLAAPRFNTSVIRIGRPPKRAIPFRTDTPFSKITANLIAPDGSTGQKLEFLCDGQQVVVFGIHPDTRKPYRWYGDKPGDELRRDQLPCITETEARRVVEDAEAVCERFGYTRVKAKTADDDGERVDWGEKVSNIVTGSDLHDSVRDLAASMIGKGMKAKDAKDMLRALMEGSKTPHDERWQERYDDIGRAVDSAVEKFRDSWSDLKPLPSGSLPVTAFRSDYMPDALAGWIDDIAERLQCPPDYVAVTAITALGSVIGRRVGIRPKQKDDWTEYANLWGLFTGPPGSMKSPAMRAALTPIHRLEVEAAKANEGALQKFKAELEAFKMRKQAQVSLEKDALKKKARGEEISAENIDVGHEPEEPSQVRYCTSDTSYESLGELLVANPNGLLVERDELVSLLKHLDNEKEVRARGFYMQGWSGTDMYAFDRIMRGHLHIDAVCLSVIGNTQPMRINEYVRRANRDGGGGDGLIQRFGLLIQPDDPLSWRNVDEYPDSKARQCAWDVFERVVKLTEGAAVELGAEEDTFDKPPFFRFDKTALGEFIEWHTDQKHLRRRGGLSPALAGHLEKYSKLVPALALINHLAGGGQGAISQLSLRKALAYATYLESHARRIYGAANMVELLAARAILARIAKGDLSDGFTMRDVHRPRWMNLTEHDWVREGLDLLLDYDYLGQKTVQTGGRSKVTYTINPKAKNGGK